jgi:SAM-dependent methyltransferase
VGGRLHWDWYQRIGPGAELLGDVTGLTVAELGAGAGRQAAHVAASFPVARVVAIDNSPAQHKQGVTAYGHLPRLTLAHADAATYLSTRPGAFDVCFSVFGAIDFTDPHALLPALHTGLRPGGRLIFSTLARYRTGRAPESEARPATITAGKSEHGSPATMQRWVLDTPVWEKLLDSTGFAVDDVDELPFVP